MSAGGPSRRTWLLVIGGLGSLTLRAEPGISSSPEVARGEHLARLVCSACHVVAKDQEYPPALTLPTPNFTDIANRPGVSTSSLQHFITNTHWDGEKIPMSMPNPGLNQNDVRAVSEYIMSLRRR